MKHIKQFENVKKSKLKKLLEYLKDKGLDVEYVYNAAADHETIYGNTEERPYIIYQMKDDEIAFVDYMKKIASVDPDGTKRGAWEEKEFDIKNYEKIFDFISNIDVMISIKNYNL